MGKQLEANNTWTENAQNLSLWRLLWTCPQKKVTAYQNDFLPEGVLHIVQKADLVKKTLKRWVNATNANKSNQKIFEYISEFRVLDGPHDDFPLIFETLTRSSNTATHRGFLPTNNDATAVTHAERRHSIETNDNRHHFFASSARTNTQPTKNLNFFTENVNSTSTTMSKVITSPVNHLIYVKHQHVLKITLQPEQTLPPCISS
jgi:hypothetical protein